jgi:hypothetical protein
MPLGSNKAALFAASAQAGGARGLFSGGSGGSPVVVQGIEYVNIASLGNATDFGDLSGWTEYSAGCSSGSNDRGVTAGNSTGTPTPRADADVIEYVTISSAGNVTDFGNLTHEKYGHGAMSNLSDERGIFNTGNYNSPAGRTNDIDYITISSTGNGTDFGNWSPSVTSVSSTSNGANDRGVSMGGFLDPADNTNQISYITITSLGNSTDFGDLTGKHRGMVTTSNSTSERGIGAGGPRGTYDSDPVSNVIEYITINSTGNATDFGDLTETWYAMSAFSSGTDDRGIIGGGVSASASPTNQIEYVTISSAGNSTDFGDLTVVKKYGGDMGSNSD